MIKYLCIILLVCLFLYINKRTHTIWGKVRRGAKELQRGLMFRKEPLQVNEGMLFKMRPNTKKNSVWMKNTYIPLDIIFLDTNMMVVGYKMNTVPLSLKTIEITNPSSYILELNAGSVLGLDIYVGDSVHFIES